MINNEQSLRFEKLRTFILAAAILGAVGFGLGIRVEPLLLRFAFPFGLLIAAAVIIYLNLLKFRKWLLALLSILISMVIVEAAFAVIEIRSGYFLEQRGDISGTEDAVMMLHPELVYWMRPDANGFASRRFVDSIAYENVPFHTDDVGRRACPELAEPAQRHAIFFGGSFTFGQGITDEQTVPCIVQELSSGDYQAYNYGKNGYGTGQMLLLLEDDAFFEPAMPRAGFAVYSFIGDHIPRTVGEIGKLTNEDLPWMEFMLFKTDQQTGALSPYRISDNPRVHKILSGVQVFRLLSPTARFMFSRISLPLAVEEEGVRIVAEVITRSKSLYDARFEGEFFVILWPRVGLETASEALFIDLLEAEGIRVVDVPELPEDVTAQIHPRDVHPSIAEYRWVAAYFYDFISTGNPQE